MILKKLILKYLTTITLILFCFFSLSSVQAGERDYLPNYDNFLTDRADVISPDKETEINNLLSGIKKETSAEIAVLTIRTTGELPIEMYSIELAEEWKVGKKELDNGIIIIAAIDDRKWRIEVGYGLEGTIPDIMAKRVGEKNLVPYFKNSDYAGGFIATINDLNLLIKNDPTTIQEYKNDDLESLNLIKILFFIGFIIIAINRFLHGDDKKARSIYVFVISAIFGILATILTGLLVASVILFIILFIIGVAEGGSGGGWSSGGWSSGGGGSSFGGFSGGSFGGGGASGGW